MNIEGFFLPLNLHICDISCVHCDMIFFNKKIKITFLCVGFITFVTQVFSRQLFCHICETSHGLDNNVLIFTTNIEVFFWLRNYPICDTSRDVFS